jgi:hypothetical protein
LVFRAPAVLSVIFEEGAFRALGGVVEMRGHRFSPGMEHFRAGGMTAVRVTPLRHRDFPSKSLPFHYTPGREITPFHPFSPLKMLELFFPAGIRRHHQRPQGEQKYGCR